MIYRNNRACVLVASVLLLAGTLWTAAPARGDDDYPPTPPCVYRPGWSARFSRPIRLHRYCPPCVTLPYGANRGWSGTGVPAVPGQEVAPYEGWGWSGFTRPYTGGMYLGHGDPLYCKVYPRCW